MVDDEQLVVELIQSHLEKSGYEHFAFQNVWQALAFFRQNSKSIDLALIDLALPIMTGDQLARQLKEIAPDLPIIVITGHVEVKEIDGNINRIMYKPISQHDLIDAIEQLIGH